MNASHRTSAANGLTAAHHRLCASRWPAATATAWALAILVAAYSVPASADDAAAPAAPTSGTWQAHKYSFQFMGFTSTYSCDGLADQVKTLLLTAGARNDAKSRPGACASGFGRPDKFARADLVFSTLAPVEGDAAPGSKPVKAVWRTVRFAEPSPQNLRIGDCELVEQFRTQVLPMFTTRNVVNKTTCIPYQDSGSLVDLQFDVLAPVAPIPH